MFYCFIVVICTSCAVRYFVMCWRRCHLCCCRYILDPSLQSSRQKSYHHFKKEATRTATDGNSLARLLIPLLSLFANQKHYIIFNNTTRPQRRRRRRSNIDNCIDYSRQVYQTVAAFPPFFLSLYVVQ